MRRFLKSATLVAAAGLLSSGALAGPDETPAGPPEDVPRAPETVPTPPDGTPRAPEDVPRDPDAVPAPPEETPPPDAGDPAAPPEGDAGTPPEGAARPEGVPFHKGGNPAGRPWHGRGRLAPPEGAEEADAMGRVDAAFFPSNARRAERSWVRLRVRRLAADTEYTVWMSDPSGAGHTQVASFTTNGAGAFNWVQDTRREGTIPFGGTAKDLAGAEVEVRDAAGTTVLAGALPAVQ